MAKNPAEAAIPVRIPQDTPANAVRHFINALNNPWEPNFAMAVAGARVGYYGDDIWNKARMELHPFSVGVNFKVDDATVETQSDTEATVTVTGHKEFRQGNEVKRGATQKYTVQLHHEEMPLPGDGAGQDVWRVVPAPIEDVLDKDLFKLSPLSLVATLALRDPRLLPLLQQLLAANQLKQLALGTMQFTQDYQEMYAFDDQAHERALLPYIKSPQLFTIIGTKDEKWRFNDLLAGKSLAALSEVARTVLFYDGDATSTESLHFRFGDKTLIGFADGHVKALSKDELKDIIWNPSVEAGK